MGEPIEFARNYSDLSTDRGFQFEFFCDRCGTGYRTPFRAFALGTVSEVMDAASGLLGGILSRAADLSERARSATWERAHDEAFARAVKEMRPRFVQCPRCLAWVCRERCWNEDRGLCKECAPDLGVEMAAAQAERTVAAVHEHAEAEREVEEELKRKETWKGRLRATCPQCGAALPGKVKFCPECGAPIAKARHCAECGAELPARAKFCPECGTPVR